MGGIVAAVRDEVGDLARDHRGLAATGTGQDEHRPIDQPHGLALLVVQALQDLHGHLGAQRRPHATGIPPAHRAQADVGADGDKAGGFWITIDRDGTRAV